MYVFCRLKPQNQPMAISQSTIKLLKALHLKKYRQKYNNFIAEGDKIVGELLKQSAYKIKAVYALDDWIVENESLLQSSGVVYEAINDKTLKSISQLKTPNKVLTLVEMPAHKTTDTSLLTQELNGNWAIFLDGLQDPGNVGTILRIADWFAIPHVLAGPGTVDIYNSKVLQASMGAFLRVKWSTVDYEQLASLSKDIPLYAADMGGDNVFDIETPNTAMLAIGNEGKGLSSYIRSLGPQILSIHSPNGGAESLNAAIATGILCAAIRR